MNLSSRSILHKVKLDAIFPSPRSSIWLTISDSVDNYGSAAIINHVKTSIGRDAIIGRVAINTLRASVHQKLDEYTFAV